MLIMPLAGCKSPWFPWSSSDFALSRPRSAAGVDRSIHSDRWSRLEIQAGLSQIDVPERRSARWLEVIGGGTAWPCRAVTWGVFDWEKPKETDGHPLRLKHARGSARKRYKSFIRLNTLHLKDEHYFVAASVAAGGVQPVG